MSPAQGLWEALRLHLLRREAASAVAVPEEVVDLLADVREHLQDKCEPPVYVSDRRLVKAVALMQARLMWRKNTLGT